MGGPEDNRRKGVGRGEVSAGDGSDRTKFFVTILRARDQYKTKCSKRLRSAKPILFEAIKTKIVFKN